MKVPRFKSSKEERELWDTHDSTDYHDNFKITKNVVFARPKKEVISLRLEPKFTLQLHKNYMKREAGVLKNFYTCLRVAPPPEILRRAGASAKAGRHL